MTQELMHEVQAHPLHSEYAGIHFMKAARYGFVGSAILIFFTIIIYFAIGINLGIDFVAAR